MGETILQVFFDQVHEIGKARSALVAKRGGDWISWTWEDYGAEVCRAARGLRALEVGPGDRVVILSANRPEWLFVDLAAMCLGAAGIGAYPNDLSDNVRYLVEHARAKVLVVDTGEQLDKTRAWRDRVDTLRWVIVLDPEGVESAGKVLTWHEVLEQADPSLLPDSVLEEEARRIPAEQLAMIVYTSGTTGPPKGAMYSHANLLYESQALKTILVRDEQVLTTLSFLPLCHIAERLQGELVAILAGATVHFAESLDKLKDNLAEVRPTVLLAVPRVWEKFYAAIRAQFDAATGLTRLLVERTLSAGTVVAHCRNHGVPIPLLVQAQWRILRPLVVDRLKTALGLERVSIFLSGAAPLSRTVAEFFGALDMDIHEVYGQTECVGVCTVNPPGAIRFGTVGLPQAGCEVILGDDQEVLVRGPNVFLGYLDDPEATREAVDDQGWLHTGDVGTFTPEGYLIITDRKKDIIVTAGGKNVAPQNIENILKTYPGVSQVVVTGDRRKYLVALIALDPGASDALSAAAGLSSFPVEVLREREEVREVVQKYVDEVNASLPGYSRIKYFRFLPRELSVEAGEMTPSLKVKRRVVEARYRDLIETMYDE